jgi:hypothetical protein
MKVGDLIRIKPELITTRQPSTWRKKLGIVLDVEGEYVIVYWDKLAPCLIEYVDYLEKIPLTKSKNMLYYNDKEEGC